jgi:circadian clock protein KaiB
MTDESAPDRLRLTLFINGASPCSARAVQRLRGLCARNCPAGYDLEIVDIYQQPALVAARGIVAVPTLIKDLPLPICLLAGDLSDECAVLAALGLPAREPAQP